MTTRTESLTHPFDQAAHTYQTRGFHPIPVHEKGPPVKGATGYAGTVTPEKIAAWLSPHASVRRSAGRWWLANNIAIRHRGTLAIDLDEGGDVELLRFAEHRNLPDLPDTWSSTAHGPRSPVRQYLYRIPVDDRFETGPCPNVDLCVWHHRYTVCWPSVHPGSGAVYRWYRPGGEGGERPPEVAELALLPAAWVAAFNR